MAATAAPATIDFETHRAYLFAIAYRMLGSASEAEDMVQETFLRAHTSVAEPEQPRAYLATIVTRLCLDHLKSARVQREQYFGPWLPEPILAQAGDARLEPEGVVDAHESVSFAFLVALETLSPVERAAVILHDVFDYEHREVAEMVGRAETACRQALHRTRTHLAERRPRFTASPEERRRLTEAFLQAAAFGDLAAIQNMLAADALATSDGGGKVPAATRPVLGADRVAKYIVGFRDKEPIDDIRIVEVNGEPGIVLSFKGGLRNVILLEFEPLGLVTRVDIVRNPEKLRFVPV